MAAGSRDSCRSSHLKRTTDCGAADQSVQLQLQLPTVAGAAGADDDWLRPLPGAAGRGDDAGKGAPDARRSEIAGSQVQQQQRQQQRPLQPLSSSPAGQCRCSVAHLSPSRLHNRWLAAAAAGCIGC